MRGGQTGHAARRRIQCSRTNARMFPIRDDTPRFSTPYVTYFLIAFNLLIFFFEWSLTPESLDLLIRQFGFIPSHISAVLSGSGRLTPGQAFVPVLTSMFLHGSWMHVI